MKKDNKFIPSLFFRSPMVQTMLASSKLRNLKSRGFISCADEVIIDCPGNVKLQGFLSKGDQRESKGLVILLHGWEGSSNSAYIVSAARGLFDCGYDIFRLNLRDHGDTHHLNEGVFLGTLIDDTFSAVKTAALSAGALPVFIVGFSMGGNFAIRIAHRCSSEPIDNLKHVVCISPALDPMKATMIIDSIKHIRKYFLKKWKRSIVKKQSLYPHLYDFSDILKMDNCMEMTEVLIKQITDYGSAENYFSHYTLTRGYLDEMEMPLTIITSKDDPVIPVEDFYQTRHNDNVALDIQSYGGHCGFINGISLQSWYLKKIADIFDSRIAN